MAVSDSGIGIAPEDIPKVMERFGMVDSSMARQHTGTGLGLPLSKQLAEAHGGSLVLESTVNVGTTVTVTLPAERLIPRRPPAQRPKRFGLRNFQPEILYPTPEVWCGRTCRQPGQVRKKAAVTNSVRVVPGFHLLPEIPPNPAPAGGGACYSPAHGQPPPSLTASWRANTAPPISPA